MLKGLKGRTLDARVLIAYGLSETPNPARNDYLAHSELCHSIRHPKGSDTRTWSVAHAPTHPSPDTLTFSTPTLEPRIFVGEKDEDLRLLVLPLLLLLLPMLASLAASAAAASSAAVRSGGGSGTPTEDTRAYLGHSTSSKMGSPSSFVTTFSFLFLFRDHDRFAVHGERKGGAEGTSATADRFGLIPTHLQLSIGPCLPDMTGLSLTFRSMISGLRPHQRVEGSL